MADSAPVQGIRKRLARKIGPVPEALWADLRQRRFVQEALDFPDGYKKLEREALRVRQLARDLAPRRGLAHPGPIVQRMRALLTTEEAERAWTFSRHVGRIAAKDRRVVAVRDRLFDGKPLPPLTALALFRSPAIYLLSRDDFAALDMPIAGHSAEADRSGPPPQDQEWSETICLRLRAGRHRIRRTFELKRSSVGETRLLLPDFLGGEHSELPALPGSVAGDLHATSQWLHDFYPWEERDGLWFTLTGQPPWVHPLQVGIRHRKSEGHFERMVLDFAVEPWISAGTVLRVLRASQSALLRRKNRAITSKSLGLLDFVEEQRASDADATWRALAVVWNSRSRDPSDLDHRHLQRDYLRARRTVLLPGYESGAVAAALTRLAKGKATAARRRGRAT
jgi:hypothetical protein